MAQCLIVFAPHGVELKEAVEVHELDARGVVDVLSGAHRTQVALHGIEGAGVAVGHGVAQQSPVATYAYEVYAPCVDAYAADFYAAATHVAKSAKYFVVEAEDVPVEVTTYFG